jgi:hypothetical protein
MKHIFTIYTYSSFCLYLSLNISFVSAYSPLFRLSVSKLGLCVLRGRNLEVEATSSLPRFRSDVPPTRTRPDPQPRT